MGAYGPTLSLLAPGVFIRTCDIQGPRGSPLKLSRTLSMVPPLPPHTSPPPQR